MSDQTNSIVCNHQRRIADKKNRSDAINRALLQRDITIESLKAELFATRLLLLIGIVGTLGMLQ